MSLRHCRVYVSHIFVSLFLLASAAVPAARAQQSTAGTVTVTVVDQSGAIVSGANLELRDSATGAVRTGVTQDSGAYSFVGLNVGTYSLTITKEGFAKQVFASVIVHATQVTDVNAALKVGVASETVTVHETAAPLVETTTNAISTNIDLKEVEDLPLGGRDLTSLAQLVPGTVNIPGQGPTWNGLPVMAQGSNVDGVIGNTNRMKFEGSAANPDISPRIEDISEMTVQTAHLDANQGNGQSSMEVNYVTRQGTNSFHGRAFEDFQNAYLNANSWTNDATGTTKPRYELNDFGGSVGGPIIHDKLFFFGSYAESKQPGTTVFNNGILSPLAQQGVYTLGSGSAAGSTICLFTYNCPNGGSGVVDQYNAAHGSGFPTATATGPANAVTGLEIANINKYAVPLGVVGNSPNGDPNWQNFDYQLNNPTTTYYPTVRVDYNMSQSVHFNVAWNMTKTENPYGAEGTFPGAPYAGQGAGSTFKDYTAAFGFDWIIKPTLVNQFRGGFLYHYDGFGIVGFNNIEKKDPYSVGWNYPGVNYPFYNANGGYMSGQNFNLPTPDYYPVFNFSDSMTWQHGQHSLSFGGSWYREQDHYWNAPAGYAGFTLGLASGDPALSMFTASNLGIDPSDTYDISRIEQLYAILAGRVQSVTGTEPVNLKTGEYATGCCSAYNLDELSYASNLFLQDSWRIKPNLTLNYGLAWSFTVPQHDLTGAYHSVDLDSMYGPSGVGNLFNPGVFDGTNTPVYTANGSPYAGWYKTPQPSVGIAWSPRLNQGFLGKLTGNGNTVVRAGFAIKDSIEPYQYFWDYATDQASFYYANFGLNATPSASPGQGYFTAGTMSLSCTSGSCPSVGTLPTLNVPSPTSYLDTPFPTYQTILPMADTTFTGYSSWGLEPHIKQPYTESWNFGIQRQIGANNAIEIRYVGNRVVHQWIGFNINEVNAFGAKAGDPTFLAQFQQAQKNLSINAANGKPGTFANYGFAGEGPTPVFDAAFAGEPTVNGALEDYSDPSGTYIPDLQTGQVGAMAATLDNPYGPTPGNDPFCNLVGASFGPCSSTIAGGQGYTGAGAGYPINYFQANPYNAGNGSYLLTNGGYSTYNALQVDFRQKNWHGMQFDVNYTWSHNLGLETRNDWEGTIDNGYTLRDPHLSYGPTLYDIRDAIHASGTYDLPFGAGKKYLNQGGVVNRVVGGWTLGTIFTFQSGIPFTLSGGYHTFNDYADGGVALTGVTRSQIQSAVGAYTTPGNPVVSLINPSLLSGWVSGGSLAANTAPGTIAAPEYFYGPHFINDDLAITKTVPIRENLRFSLQGEFINAFNHPNFGNYGGYSVDTGVRDGAGFGTVYGTLNNARRIELRANLEF
jgi:hypothetical protein